MYWDMGLKVISDVMNCFRLQEIKLLTFGSCSSKTTAHGMPITLLKFSVHSSAKKPGGTSNRNPPVGAAHFLLHQRAVHGDEVDTELCLPPAVPAVLASPQTCFHSSALGPPPLGPGRPICQTFKIYSLLGSCVSSEYVCL